MEFLRSDRNTIGIELELQLLNPDTLDLVDGIIPLMELYPDAVNVKPEFIQNTVEVTTRICTGCDELYTELATVVRELQQRCRTLNMSICGSGTHPFSQRLALITPQPRYKKMEKVSGYQGHIQITFATHIHIGVESGQQAIEIMDRLKAYIPLMIAVSANSPFWRGHDTGFVSYRHIILAAARSYGVPPSFGTWQRFLDFMQTTTKAGIFETVNDIHWDIRPRPHLGTIEIRLLDSQSTVSEAITLAAFVRTLVNFIRDFPEMCANPGLPQPLHWWLEKENRFQASRKGLKAIHIHNDAGDSSRLADIWQRVFETIRPVAEPSGDDVWLDRLHENISSGSGCMRQISSYKENQSFTDVVRHMIDELDTDLANS